MIKSTKKGKIKPASKDGRNIKRIVQWETTHNLIMDTYRQLIEENGGSRMPTQTEVAKRSNLTQATVNIHVKGIKFDFAESEYKALTPHVIMNIFNASKTNAQSQALWMKVVEGWSETSEHNIKVSEIPPIIFVPAKYDEDTTA